MTEAAGGGSLIFLIAGEASGDVIGAHLMAALKRQCGGTVRFTGVGGDRMAAEGLASLFPIDELAVMVDTFRPLELGEAGTAADDGRYAWSWSGRGPSA